MKTFTSFLPTHSMTSDLINEMDRFFSVSPARQIYSEMDFNPACEIAETDNHYIMSVDLPGMQKDDIKIEIHDSVLTISGERKRSLTTEKNERVQRYEKTYGFFKRSFDLPKTVDSDKVEAGYENGVLELYLPKTQKSKPRKIELTQRKGGYFDKLIGSKKNDNESKQA